MRAWRRRSVRRGTPDDRHVNESGAVARQALAQCRQKLFSGCNPHTVASETFSDEVEADGAEFGRACGLEWMIASGLVHNTPAPLP